MRFEKFLPPRAGLSFFRSDYDYVRKGSKGGLLRAISGRRLVIVGRGFALWIIKSVISDSHLLFRIGLIFFSYIIVLLFRILSSLLYCSFLFIIDYFVYDFRCIVFKYIVCATGDTAGGSPPSLSSHLAFGCPQPSPSPPSSTSWWQSVCGLWQTCSKSTLKIINTYMRSANWFLWGILSVMSFFLYFAAKPFLLNGVCQFFNLGSTLLVEHPSRKAIYEPIRTRHGARDTFWDFVLSPKKTHSAPD